MPKQKTHSGAKKRFKLTGKGKIKRRSSKLNHILAKRPRKNKRRLHEPQFVAAADVNRIKRMLAI